ncbi:DUF4320 family protein [Terribacillus saccharophilus]|uniref:DUF4320 family protein n=1 Tax=Terribacillus saccharophilus TaxID=361277 RepID=UPI002989AE09|nr:DUF4320 family protein [Terribacillus saccharophilus]MCM3227709.1 DUF4320 family protein [Terribacillus saccharophilus]
MKGAVATGFFFLSVLALVVFVPDIIVYGVQSGKANDAIQEITLDAEQQGGITNQVKANADETMKRYGLDNRGYSITYSDSGQIQHGGRFNVELDGEYTFKAFNLLGTGVGQFSLPIHSSESGSSNVWWR